MFLYAEQRRIPALQGMALRALSFFRTGFELAFVWIRLVTVVAVFEWQGALEVTISVALGATDLSMFSDERILCL